MVERFTYRQELLQELRHQSAVRFRLWLVVLGFFWAFGLQEVIAYRDLIVPAGVVAATVAVVLLEAFLRRLERATLALTGQAVEYDGARLRQISPDGAILGEVDLNTPFAVTLVHSAAGLMIYRVAQEAGSETARSLEFSSRITGRGRLVHQILHFEE
jgi:hypothetical protein